MNEYLDDKTFFVYCMKSYENPQCVSDAEFLEDINRIKYIKKLFTRYEQNGELKERLILNHLIILSNVFGPVHLPRILFLKMKNQLHLLKPFLLALDILPKYVINVGKKGRVIDTDDIPLDPAIITALREILKNGKRPQADSST